MRCFNFIRIKERAFEALRTSDRRHVQARLILPGTQRTLDLLDYTSVTAPAW
jgi:hypothetical protein